MNDTINNMIQRITIREYNNNIVEEEKILEIVKAGLYAANSMGREPWHFSVVTNKEILNLINKACVEYRLSQNIDTDKDYHTFYHAPAVIFLSGDSRIEASITDCANAAQNMCVASYSEGLGSCYNASFKLALNTNKKDEIYRLLQVPKHYELYFAVAIGYTDSKEKRVKDRKYSVSYIR